jgi:hypothetical protein
MLRRKTTGAVALSLGVVLFIAGIVDHLFAAPKAALCQSGIGPLAQGSPWSSAPRSCTTPGPRSGPPSPP